MDWGSVALIVLANVITTAILMAGAIWYVKHRLLGLTAPAEAAEQGGPEVEMPAVEPALRQQRPRNAAPSRNAGQREPEQRRRGLKEHLDRKSVV